MGYHRAGFDVVGVDIAPQPNYPFEFHQADAIAYPLEGFDAIHASPPCQAYSSLNGWGKQGSRQRVYLIEPIRARLLFQPTPYVIENVVPAPLLDPVTLCGQYFGLAVRRHRKFETSFRLEQPHCSPFHLPRPVAVYGDHPQQSDYSRRFIADKKARIYRALTLEHGKWAMGVDWYVTWRELCEMIPPAFTSYIGLHLRDIL